jgi:hypothetical protein
MKNMMMLRVQPSLIMSISLGEEEAEVLSGVWLIVGDGMEYINPSVGTL